MPTRPSSRTPRAACASSIVNDAARPARRTGHPAHPFYRLVVRAVDLDDLRSFAANRLDLLRPRLDRNQDRRRQTQPTRDAGNRTTVISLRRRDEAQGLNGSQPIFDRVEATNRLVLRSDPPAQFSVDRPGCAEDLERRQSET